MKFISTSGFIVSHGKGQEFQEWVRKNENALAKVCPKGVELVGFYTTIFGPEKHSGSTKVFWQLDSYGALDSFAKAAGEDSEFARLLDEFGAFSDSRTGGGCLGKDAQGGFRYKHLMRP